MDYSKLSDLEINFLVAKALGYTHQGHGWIDNADGLYNYIAKSGDPNAYREALPDYCNSWTHAGPIIEKEKISLMFGFGHWDAMSQDGESLQAEEANPLRAAMIVFLMMYEVKK